MDYLIYNLADASLLSLADASLLPEPLRAEASGRGTRYLLTRCLLYSELARRLGCAPQDIRLHREAMGKPVCEGIEVNISHSGDCFAMVFDRAPVGIDVEHIRPRRHLAPLAARIMAPPQLAAFRRRGCLTEEFYACWCAAEALVKQAGASIWQASSFPFTYARGSICLPPPNEGVASTSVQLFSPAPGYQGAVACTLPPAGGS